MHDLKYPHSGYQKQNTFGSIELRGMLGLLACMVQIAADPQTCCDTAMP